MFFEGEDLKLFGKVGEMSDINWDKHLEPKYRRRTKDEIDSLIADEYRDYLNKKIGEGRVFYLLTKLSEKDQKQVVDDLIEQVIETTDMGMKDKEFMKEVDFEDLEFEVC